ncbi:protein of unknown function [Methylocella tundrae]|uniref:Uncharacterized protein n=1 Tax=Methylocella tundrae TaxID=227605 RepID=A0A4U8YYH4_METTU|nr:protein of unknown function [Methylocella tundrae]
MCFQDGFFEVSDNCGLTEAQPRCRCLIASKAPTQLRVDGSHL